MRHVFGGAGIVDEDIEAAPSAGGRDDPAAILVLRDVAINIWIWKVSSPWATSTSAAPALRQSSAVASASVLLDE